MKINEKIEYGKLNEEDRISLKKRNAVQEELIRKMVPGGEKKGELQWAKDYAINIHEIINNLENNHIRKLINEELYEEAANEIIIALSEYHTKNI